MTKCVQGHAANRSGDRVSDSQRGRNYGRRQHQTDNDQDGLRSPSRYVSEGEFQENAVAHRHTDEYEAGDP